MNDVTVEQLASQLEEGWTGWVYASSPFCGTCQLAEQMLQIVEQLEEIEGISKLNIQLAPQFAQSNQIESVPAMIYYKDGRLQNRTYRFDSVVDLQRLLKEGTQDVNGL
ncbi:thioredoxin family protein [Shouchella sp. JSM 1781072]|uniref:thioredoxin family protein n=1 Tax=Shouchella sp. JSM 1781072 TaxID=3344581 RepID=UPI0035BFD34D